MCLFYGFRLSGMRFCGFRHPEMPPGGRHFCGSHHFCLLRCGRCSSGFRHPGRLRSGKDFSGFRLPETQRSERCLSGAWFSVFHHSGMRFSALPLCVYYFFSDQKTLSPDAFFPDRKPDFPTVSCVLSDPPGFVSAFLSLLCPSFFLLTNHLVCIFSVLL